MITSIVQKQFAGIFGSTPDILVSAPGRVNLIGEHTDYNDGFVLPVAIDRVVTVAVGRRRDERVCLYSVNFDERSCFDLRGFKKEQTSFWANYPKGVIAELQGRGHRLSGFDAAVYGDVPIGAGLSSSAAIETAFAYGLVRLNEIDLTQVEMAKLCQRAENRFVGVNCGIMDQFISTLGRRAHALLIDCRDLSYEYVPLPAEEVSLVVCNSGVKRGLVDSEYNTRRAQCQEGVRILAEGLSGVRALRDISLDQLEQHRTLLPEVVMRRCRHVISENERVSSAVRCLRRGDAAGFGEGMYRSHHSLRDDYEVSCEELDLLVEIARSIDGVIGARLTGAGFGGCTVNLVASDRAQSFVQEISERYQARTGIQLESYLCAVEDGVREMPDTLSPAPL